jgi:hypothetical protein
LFWFVYEARARSLESNIDFIGLGDTGAKNKVSGFQKKGGGKNHTMGKGMVSIGLVPLNDLITHDRFEKRRKRSVVVDTVVI